MNTEHTPAPWKVAPVNTNGTDGFEIHYSEDGECVTDHVYELADAKLIAAAPELLEICKEALRMYEKVLPTGGWQHVHDGLMDAIKKATT